MDTLGAMAGCAAATPPDGEPSLELARSIRHALSKTNLSAFSLGRLQVRVSRGEILLTGEVLTPCESELAASVAAAHGFGLPVRNHLAVWTRHDDYRAPGTGGEP